MPLKARRFENEVNEFQERIESSKAAVVGAIVGSVAFSPLDLAINFKEIAQWEYNTDQMALQGALFALVYRYATREDKNAMLKQGVVGAFTLVRALPLVKVPSVCEPIPLRCGSPLSYLNWDMLFQLSMALAESGIAFAAVAYAFDSLADKGLLGRFPSLVCTLEKKESDGMHD